MDAFANGSVSPIRPTGSVHPAVEPVAPTTRTSTDTATGQSSTQPRPRPLRDVVSSQTARHVAVEWHQASQSYVHRILDAHTGEQISQYPAAQVLDMVADLMIQIHDSSAG